MSTLNDFIQELLNDDSIQKRIDTNGNVHRIHIIGRGENLFFQENEKYLFCLIEARHGVIYANSIKKWEPNEKMSPSEKARVARLIEKYYKEVYNPDGFLG